MRRIFQMYFDEGLGSYSIAVLLTDEGIPTQTGKLLWLQSRVHHILGNATYTGSWVYGKYRHVSTEDGVNVYDQPWERAQALKRKRSRKAKRNMNVHYLMQHLLRSGECGHNFHARCTRSTTNVGNGRKYRYELPTPSRYYMCN